MRGAVLHGPGDVRFEERAAPAIAQPTDAVIRISATCVCGSDLWDYRGINPVTQPKAMGHEYCGIVEDVGSAVRSVKPGQFVIGSFFASDNTCPNCRAGYQSGCQHAEFVGGAQAPVLRVPLADGTLVATPELPSDDLIPSLLALSDVMGTGWFAADAANVKPGATVVVVGDGAVGPPRRALREGIGAERIIVMSRHESRQKLAREFGATDIVAERGDEGVARVKELTAGIGADAVLECVGTQESMLQAIRSARPGGYVGYVGVPHGVELDGEELFYAHVHLHGGPAPVRRFLPDLIDLVLERENRSRQGVRPYPAPGSSRRGLPGDGRAARDQDAVAPVVNRKDPVAMSTHPTAARESFGRIAPALAQYTDEVLFGDVWERPGLSKRDRSLVTIASLISLYRINELPFHLKRALQNGVTRDEIIEVITHLAFYSGWPTANTALPIAQRAFEEAGV